MKKVSNKSVGTEFERYFAEELAKNWFWVHRFQDNKNGQPCDVIACRNGNTYLFDCKDCQNDAFQLSRVEENQYNAMLLFEMTGNGRGMFAIRFQENEVFLIQGWMLNALKTHGTKSLDIEYFRNHSIRFEDWMQEKNEADEWSGTEHEGNDWK